MPRPSPRPGRRSPRLRRRSVLPLALAALAVACGGTGDDTSTPSAPDARGPAVGTDRTATATTAPGSIATDGTDEPVATSPATTLTTPPSSTATPTSYDFAAIGPIVETFLAEHGLNGAGLAVVERDGGIVHEQYWGEFDADRVSLIASSSKMLTAGVLLHLADRGLLDLDAPVADAVDWGAGNPAITPAQLLSNSSGLVGLLPDPGYPPYVCQFLPTGDIEDCAARIFTTPDDDADVVAPDTEFRYGGAQWQVAGGLAEAVSGRTWAQLVQDVYVEPCGLETLGYNNHFTQLGPLGFGYPAEFDGDTSVLGPTDNPNMEGGAFTNVRDYAEVLLMQLRGGWCGDTQVLSQAALDQMHRDRTGEVYGSATGYGLGWWVDRATGRLTDPGAYGSVAWLDPATGHGGFLLVEADTTTGSRLAAQLYEPVAAAIAAG